jgi:hypothetical protein
MDLTVFLEPKVDLPRVAHILDGLGPMGRLETIRGWDARTMSALWDAAKGKSQLTMEHFVPASVGPMTEVMHEGMNSLPVFTPVQKRMARTKDGVVFGYNDVETQVFVGPGFFTVNPGKNDGELDIDYRAVPVHRLPSWPAVAPNTDGLGRFVWGDLVDVMRGISSHVSIGSSFKQGKALGVFFAVSRVDPG